jgi:pimeloyl-ACP methyl ester carboxylesterase
MTERNNVLAEEILMNLAFKIFVMKNTIMGSLFPARSAESAAILFLTPRKYPLKSWEEEKEQQGERLSLSNGLSAIKWGESSQRVLLVHGWESRATQIAGFIDVIVDAGYQVIALDGPAHGRSTGRQANPLMFAKAVVQANDEIGPFCAIVGHSMGGSAVAIALSEGVKCNKVVLISSPSSITGVLQRFARFIGLPPESTQCFIRKVGENVGRSPEALNVAELIKSVSSRALIIHDHNDLEVPYSDAVAIQKNWQGASLVSTTGYGHRLIIRQVNVWQSIVKFIAS